jgi:cell shape-determining protein MreC
MIWPQLSAPLLFVFSSSVTTAKLSQIVLFIAFAFQLLLLFSLYISRGRAAKLHVRLQNETSKNAALNERTKSIGERMKQQDEELKTTRSEAQKLLLTEARVSSLKELVTELKTVNDTLTKENVRLSKDVQQLRAGKPAGAWETVRGWVEKVFP